VTASVKRSTVTRTPEQKDAFKTLGRLCQGRRVQIDPEGWPFVKLTHGIGRLEWHDSAHVAVWIGGRTMRSMTLKLKRFSDIPGLIRHQMGDTECRVLFPSEKAKAVATAGRAQRKRVLSPERRAAAAVRLRDVRPRPSAKPCGDGSPAPAH